MRAATGTCCYLSAKRLAVLYALLAALVLPFFGACQQRQAQPPAPTRPGTGPAVAERGTYPADCLFITAERESYTGGLTLAVPGLSLEAPVLAGTGRDVLGQGVGLYEYSALPGPLDGNANVCIAGSGDEYNKEFRDLEALAQGDALYLVWNGARYCYAYESTQIIEADDWSVIHCTDYPCLTLTSTYPTGTADRRIAVRARLTGIER